MTIVTALREGESSLLIAADKIAFDELTQVETSVEKLYLHPKASVVIGCAGNLQMARDFGKWFQELDIQQDWTQVERLLREHLAIMHGQERGLVELRREQWSSNHVVHCLVIGSLNAQNKILEITETSQFHDEFYAIGSVVRQAYAARFAITQLTQNHAANLSKVQVLWTITTGAIYSATQRPIDLVRVTTGSLPERVNTCPETIWPASPIEEPTEE